MLTGIAASTAVSTTSVKPGHTGFSLPLSVTSDNAKFLLTVSKLARAPVATIPDFVPVTAHLGFIKSVSLFIEVTGGKVHVDGFALIKDQRSFNDHSIACGIIPAPIVKARSDSTGRPHSGSSVPAMSTILRFAEVGLSKDKILIKSLSSPQL